MTNPELSVVSGSNLVSGCLIVYGTQISRNIMVANRFAAENRSLHRQTTPWWLVLFLVMSTMTNPEPPDVFPSFFLDLDAIDSQS
jgi:hypothetical protein